MEPMKTSNGMERTDYRTGWSALDVAGAGCLSVMVLVGLWGCMMGLAAVMSGPPKAAAAKTEPAAIVSEEKIQPEGKQ